MNLLFLVILNPNIFSWLFKVFLKVTLSPAGQLLVLKLPRPIMPVTKLLLRAAIGPMLLSQWKTMPLNTFKYNYNSQQWIILHLSSFELLQHDTTDSPYTTEMRFLQLWRLGNLRQWMPICLDSDQGLITCTSWYEILVNRTIASLDIGSKSRKGTFLFLHDYSLMRSNESPMKIVLMSPMDRVSLWLQYLSQSANS